MLSVWKYPIEIIDFPVVELPRGAKVLTVQSQGEQACLWVLVDPHESVMESRLFRLVGTGHLIKRSVQELMYLGTFRVRDGDLVFHLFEVTGNVEGGN